MSFLRHTRSILAAGLPHPRYAMLTLHMHRIITAALLMAAFASSAAPIAHAAAPTAESLLLAVGDLSASYISDDAMENADATARTHAYGSLIADSAFAGYRTSHAAVVEYVARLHRRADAATFLASEGTNVDRTHGVEPITLPASYGDRPALTYQARGAHGEVWVVIILSRGPYIAMLGAVDGSGAQSAVDTLQRLAAALDGRLRAAAVQTPDPPAPRPVPPVRIITLLTTTRAGRATDLFRPHSPLYWRVIWRIGQMPRGSHETVREWVWRGETILYRNSLTDSPFSGDNALNDHLLLRAVAPGTYNVSVAVTVGHLSAQATHAFRVVASNAPHR